VGWWLARVGSCAFLFDSFAASMAGACRLAVCCLRCCQPVPTHPPEPTRTHLQGAAVPVRFSATSHLPMPTYLPPASACLPACTHLQGAVVPVRRPRVPGAEGGVPARCPHQHAAGGRHHPLCRPPQEARQQAAACAAAPCPAAWPLPQPLAWLLRCPQPRGFFNLHSCLPVLPAGSMCRWMWPLA
jgi:hypothetical protein